MKTGTTVRLGLVGLSAVLMASTAVAQDAATDLPELEVIQDTPAQRKAKKKAVSVSPLAKATPTPSATAAAQTDGAATSAPAGIIVTGSGQVTDTTVPSAVSSVSQEHFDREGTGHIQRVLQNSVPGVTIQDAAGNPARSEVTYRGFDASPINGRSQGLAVYQNGIRINEAFGDVVNWDVIPSNAIEGISIVSNNPSFGLNAVGGAASITLKDGFSYQGGEIDLQIGTYGYKSAGVQAGAALGNAAIYVAAEGIQEDGFRNFSQTDVRRFFGDIGLRGTFAEVHASLTASSNEFGATAAAPVELLDRDYSNTFTSPQTQDMEVFMPALHAKVKANETLTVSGAAYYRRYRQRVIDGNLSEAEECGGGGTGTLVAGEDDDEFLCSEGDITEPVVDQNGNFVEEDDFEPVGSIERLNTDSHSWGVALELEEKARLFGFRNQFIAGASYDWGRSKYRTSSEIGTITDGYVVQGSGLFIAEPDELAPRNLIAENTYWGVYFNDALELTDQLTLTFGGRYNYARIALEDLTGEFPGLNATNTYERFNPAVGANYKITPGLSIYGGYSESNRAPTPAELGCAEEDNPCLVESFLTDDPPLDQVVGRTAELGLRGQSYVNGGQFSWSAGLFRTLLEDDILPVTAGTGPEVFFINAGETLRQGVELSANYATQTWSVYGSYLYLDATLDKCAQPDVEGECAFLRSGDRIPGIPEHVFKAGFEYWITPKWKFGADLYAETDRNFFRNEGARDPVERRDSIDGHARVDVHTSYDVTKNIQIYGFAKNIFDTEYETYGTYFEADEASEADVELGGPGFNSPLTVSPGQPASVYGGVKVKF